MAAKPWRRSSVEEDKPLTDDRKALIERYMIDAEEAEARTGGAAEEQATQAAEAERVTDESARLSAEAKVRRAAEAEAKRVAAERARLAAEAKARRAAQAEAKRAGLEKGRRAAEAKRVAEESARVSAEEEAKLLSEEKARRAAEAKRVAEESARVSAEEEAKLLAEEKSRLAAEAKRLSEEKARLGAEGKRVGKQRARLAAEAKRLAAEKARLAAEAAAAPVDPRSLPSSASAVKPPSVAATAAVAVASQAEPFASHPLIEAQRSSPTSVANTVSPNSCRITWWRGYVRSKFVARASNASAGSWTLIAESPSFSWRSSEPPAKTPAVVAAYHELMKTLDTLGWEPDGDGHAWFDARFRRAPESRSEAVLSEPSPSTPSIPAA